MATSEAEVVRPLIRYELLHQDELGRWEDVARYRSEEMAGIEADRLVKQSGRTCRVERVERDVVYVVRAPEEESPDE